MTTQIQSQSTMLISSIDSELIFDIEHLIMNYLKLNSFNKNCFSSTTIQISDSINTIPVQSYQSHTAFASKYFALLTDQENAIDIISPIISNFPNSEFGLFLSVILGKHMINCAQSLDNSAEKFEKYKNYLLNIYHCINQGNNNQKILESICYSMTVLIMIGINGNWKNGLEQLIEAAKSSNENNFENVLMISLIISNINDTFEKLKEKLSVNQAETIRAYIKGYSNIIKEFVTFLIKAAFNGPKENFVNSQLFKAFIGIIQSLKYFDINIIKIHGFSDFLINCVSFLDINQELINQICDIFDFTFSDKNNFGLFFESKAQFKMEYFVDFLNNIDNHMDFVEIKKCIELIMNVKNYYSNKTIEEIKSNPKDIQILFASSNIFSSICDNFSYVFFLPEIDIIVQDIYYYFISLPIYSISQMLLNSLKQIMQYVHFGYNFDNFQGNNKIEKKNNFKIFLYNIHNSVFNNMKLTSLDEYNNIKFKENTGKNVPRWDKYISETLKEGIMDDEKITYINNANEFYENLYEIINDLYGIKDFFDKLCQYLMSSIENDKYDLLTIDCIFMVFNKISILLMNTLPEGIFQIIDFILVGNNGSNSKLLNHERFALQFILFLYDIITPISKNKKYVYLLTEKFLEQNYSKDKMNLAYINFLYKVIVTSYQTCKNNLNENDKGISDEDKNYLSNLFNILSQKLLGNIAQISDNYLLKLIDSLFSSCFFNIYLGFFSNDVIFNIAEKFFKDANQIYNLTKMESNISNKKELYIKYIYVLFSIIKNIGNEKSSYLSELLNKNDPSVNEAKNISYFSSMINNINSIINDCSTKGQSSDSNIINSIILLYNSILKHLKEKTSLFINDFQNIINNIHNNNPENIKLFELTVSLYKNIFTYCNDSPYYIQFMNNCFDIINIINSKYKYIKSDEDKVFISNKLCEFISLYMPHLSNIICQICDKDNKTNSVFSFGFNELIETYENNDNEEYNYAFSFLVKILCENEIILNNYIKDYIIRLTMAIISHLHQFKSECNKCIPNYFIILKKFSICDKDNFVIALKRCFNDDQQIIFVIIKYLDFVQFQNYNKLEINIKNWNKSFIKEMGELQYAIDKKKVEFVSKYLKIADDMGKKISFGDKYCNNFSEVSQCHISVVKK